MRHKAILLFGTVVALCLLCLHARGQEVSAEEALELILRHIDDSEERQQASELLQSLSDNPLDLNTASSEALLSLPFCDKFFVHNLLLERSQKGGFKSVYDLKHISGAPTVYLPLLAPFLKVSPTYEDYRTPRRQRLHVGVGTDISGGMGFYDRLAPMVHFESLSDRGWSAYLVTERDRGEPAQALHRGVFDHLSFTLSRALRTGTIILGDFRVSTGQGLVMGMSRSYFSNLERQMGMPSFGRSTVRPHRSTREYGYLRGISGKITPNDLLTLHLFTGYEALDARIEKGQILTLYRTGMHRTPSELSYRHTARREAIGGYLSLDDKVFHLGLLGVAHRYTGKDGALTRHTPTGQKEPPFTSSIDWQIHLGDLLFWGEGVIPLHRSPAAVAGLSLYDDYLGRWTLSGRYLGESHTAPYASPESRFANARNESALSASWHGEVGRGLTGTLYAEYYRSLTPDPHRGANEGKLFSARLDHQGRGTRSSLWWRSTLTDKGQRHSLRMTTDLSINKSWVLKAGGQVSFRALSDLSKAVYIRLRYALEKVECEGGLHLFDTGEVPLRADASYMPHCYYTPMLRGAGLRWISKVRLSLGSRTLLHLRYTPTLYFRRPSTPLAPLLDIALSHKLS